MPCSRTANSLMNLRGSYDRKTGFIMKTNTEQEKQHNIQEVYLFDFKKLREKTQLLTISEDNVV